MKINKTNKELEKKCGNNRGFVYKIAGTRVVNQPRIRYQMNAMTLHYDPEVWHKNNLIFHFMTFNENLRNLRERERKK